MIGGKGNPTTPKTPTSLGAISEDKEHVTEQELTPIVKVNTTPKKKRKKKNVSFAGFSADAKKEFIEESSRVDDTSTDLKTEEDSELSNDLTAPPDADDSDDEGDKQTSRSKQIVSGLFVKHKSLGTLFQEEADEEEKKKQGERKYRTCNFLLSIMLLCIGLILLVPEYVASGKDLMSQDYKKAVMDIISILVAVLCILTSLFSFCFFSLCYMEPKDFKDQCDIKLEDLINDGRTIGGDDVELELKEGWIKVKDRHSGHFYYHNEKTEESSWTRPVKEIKRTSTNGISEGEGKDTSEDEGGENLSSESSNKFNVWLSTT